MFKNADSYWLNCMLPHRWFNIVTRGRVANAKCALNQSQRAQYMTALTPKLPLFVFLHQCFWEAAAVRFMNCLCSPLHKQTGIACPTRFRTRHFFNKLPLMRILQRNWKRTTDTFLIISHTTNVLLFKFRCSIFIGVRIFVFLHHRFWEATAVRFLNCLCSLLHKQTGYQTRHFFNNFTTNEDIAMKFEADCRHIPQHFSHNERTPVQISLQYLRWC
jgi:hypothetical protein